MKKITMLFSILLISSGWVWAQTDHSDTRMGFFGNGVEDGGWSEVYHYHVPEVDGDVYTWSWEELTLIGGEGRAFIFLEKLDDELWGGMQFDYEQTDVVQGDAITNGDVVDERSVGGDHANYHVVNGGSYNITLVYDSGAEEATVTIDKAGDIIADHSSTEMGLFGNAYEGGNWDAGFGLHQPAAEGHVYTWNWEAVELIEDRAFIFLEDGQWGGMQLDYAQVTVVQGDAIDNEKIVNETTVGGEHNNFYVAEGGLYDITLVYDAESDESTVTIDENVDTSGESNVQLPGKVTLDQNYPNPFNPSTRINFTLPAASHVTLQVYNVLGQQVDLLTDQVYTEGHHSVEFNAAGLTSGVYIYRLQANGNILIRQMMLVK